MTKPLIEQYRAKLISAREAAGLVNSGDCIHLGGGANIAMIIDKNLALRTQELQDVTVHTFTDTAAYDICKHDPEGRVFKWYSGFITGFTRADARARGAGVYANPATWHSVPEFIRKFGALDILFLVTAPMDKSGYFNHGLMIGHTMALAEKAAKVVAVVHEDMPTVFGGYGEAFHISDVDYVVEDHESKTYCVSEVEVCQEDRMIAENILGAGLIKDGSTLQIGIGGLPNSVLELVRTSGLKNCGFHTELMTDKMLDLIKAGVVTNNQKHINRHKTVFTFGLGSRDLYDYIDRNPAFAAYPVDYTNNPLIISQQPQMVSLNGAAQVDLTGQVASEQMAGSRPTVISGTGGQLDFVIGTLLSQDHKGCSVLAVYSEYKGNSKIVPLLEQGANVTVPRSLVDHVATEWGIARLRDLTLSERALALAAIAHPKHRDRLLRQACEAGLLPYGHRSVDQLPAGVLVRRD